jgi:hypothetical protein
LRQRRRRRRRTTTTTRTSKASTREKRRKDKKGGFNSYQNCELHKQLSSNKMGKREENTEKIQEKSDQ